MGYRYGRSDIHEISLGISIWWDMGYRHGHLGCRCGLWANDMGDGRIDAVILHIDMGHLVTLVVSPTDCLDRYDDAEL